MCSLDASGYKPCSSTKSYGGLSARRHTFSVVARSASGGISTSTSYSWTINRNPPSVEVTFPRDRGAYNRPGWRLGCARLGGLCGTVHDSVGITAVLVAIKQNTTGLYWNGRKFVARKRVYLRATLNRGQSSRKVQDWRYALALPLPDGGYTVQVRATDRLGNVSRREPAVRSYFRTDTVPPVVVLTAYPGNPSTSADARFAFSANKAVSYACVMGGQSSVCSSPVSYNNLGAGLRRFAVRATDPAGNTAVVSYSWSIVVPAKVDLTGSQVSSSGELLPGNVGDPLAVTLNNPNDVTIYVTAVTATVESTSATGCPTGWFAATPAVIPAAGVMIPPHGLVTLPAQGGVGPTVRLIESGTNQDACQGATLTLAYVASAHS
jgi:hypothetical protein